MKAGCKSIHSVMYEYSRREEKTRDPDIEDLIRQQAYPANWVVIYGRLLDQGRIPELEPILLGPNSHSLYVVNYCLFVAKTRIPEFEQYLTQQQDAGTWMVYYAKELSTGRIPEFEQWLQEFGEDYDVFNYCKHVAKGPVPELECRFPGQSGETWWAFRYANEVCDGHVHSFSERGINL